MAIEIRELYIKAVIDTGGGKKAGEGSAGAATGAEGHAPGGGEANAEQMISLCVEKVMEILNEKKER